MPTAEQWARYRAFEPSRIEAIYKDYCAFQGQEPVEPCPWDLQRAMLYRRGQRRRDQLDKATRIAARYWPREEAQPASTGEFERRVVELEGDVAALLRHQHQVPGATRGIAPVNALAREKPLEWIK